MRLFRRSTIGVAVAAGLISLTGCSISYDVEVLLRDGQVTFDMSYSRFILGRDEACLEELTIREVSEAQPIAWQLQAPESECREVRYLPYGGTPAGLLAVVPASRLQAGQLYNVTLRALGGWGRKTFVILPENHDFHGRIATIP